MILLAAWAALGCLASAASQEIPQPELCPSLVNGSRANHGSWIVENEDSRSTICNNATGLCRSYTHFIFVVSVASPLHTLSAGALFSVDRGQWSQAGTHQTIFQTHLIGNTSVVLSAQFDQLAPLQILSAPRQICAIAWVKDLDANTCGQLSPLCMEMQGPFFESSRPLSAPLYSRFKFGNWSTSCATSSCRILGHLALNVVPRHPSITKVSLVGELAWASSPKLPSSSSWFAVGSGAFLAVFDQLKIGSEQVRGPRYHYAIDVRMPAPIPQFACIRMRAHDDTSGDVTTVQMHTGDESGGVYVGKNVRCYSLRNLQSSRLVLL